ncbi:MAG: hypothetical protein WCT24_02495 [Patescibacteria group bacterium]
MDWQAQQFYELTPEGTPVMPGGEAPKPAKKIALPLFVLMTVLILLAGGYVLYRIWTPSSPAPTTAVCAVGDASCATSSALATNELSSCATLRDDAKIACEDLVYNAQARSSGEIKGCKKIQGEELRAGCEADFAAEEALARIAGAIVTGNPEECTALPAEEDQVSCLDMIVGTDADADGLSLQDEYAAGTLDSDTDADNDGLLDGEEVQNYGTDPRASDTDGDGFTDFQEVQSNHNPLKP